jgi:hypothetical protein
MALGIYSLGDGTYTEHSYDTAMTNPITTVHHGRDGTVTEKKLYVKSDNSSTYTLINVIPITLSSSNDIGLGSDAGNTGWGVKVMADPGRTPTENDWAQVEYGASVSIASIGSSSEVRGFYFRIESPRGIPVGNKTNISLQLQYLEIP